MQKNSSGGSSVIALCGIINTWFELKISHPNVGQGQINPVPAKLDYMPAPSLFPNVYHFLLCPSSSFNVSPTSSTTRRGHKQITGWCLGSGIRSGGRQGEPRSEVPHPRPFWKIPFLPFRDKKYFYHAEMNAFKSKFFP